MNILNLKWIKLTQLLCVRCIFLAISAVLGLLCPHCFSCYQTMSTSSFYSFFFYENSLFADVNLSFDTSDDFRNNSSSEKVDISQPTAKEISKK